MIILQINPVGIEKTEFVASSEIEEDFDYAAWMTVRDLVHKIDERLKTATEDCLSDEEDGSPSDWLHKGFGPITAYRRMGQ